MHDPARQYLRILLLASNAKSPDYPAAPASAESATARISWEPEPTTPAMPSTAASSSKGGGRSPSKLGTSPRRQVDRPLSREIAATS
jgi:hypothetical protein